MYIPVIYYFFSLIIGTRVRLKSRIFTGRFAWLFIGFIYSDPRLIAYIISVGIIYHVLLSYNQVLNSAEYSA